MFPCVCVCLGDRERRVQRHVRYPVLAGRGPSGTAQVGTGDSEAAWGSPGGHFQELLARTRQSHSKTGAEKLSREQKVASEEEKEREFEEEREKGQIKNANVFQPPRTPRRHNLDTQMCHETWQWFSQQLPPY